MLILSAPCILTPLYMLDWPPSSTARAPANADYPPEGNDHERAHQVSLMGQIYGQASQVRICLGYGDDGHAEEVTAFLYRFNRMFEEALRTRKGWDSFPWPGPDDPVLRDPAWKSLAFLLQQPWFCRGWVVQEAGLARQACVHWGTEKFSWLSLIRAVIWSTRRGGSLFDSLRVRPPILHMDIYKATYRDEAKTLFPKNLFRTWTLLETLHYARYLGISDQRDRIFAFLGLPAAAHALQDVNIDYEKQFLEVYWDFACSYLDQKGGLELLNFLNHDHASLSEESEYPSWVPQWHGSDSGFTVKRRHDRRISPEKSRLQRRSPRQFLRISRNILRVRGLMMDSVAAVIQDPFTRDTTIQDLAFAWNRFRDHSESSPTAYTTFPAILAYFHALVHGSTPAMRSHEEAMSRNEKYMGYLQGQYQIGTPADEPACGLEDHCIDYLHAHVQRCVNNRCVAVTHRGYIALAPRATLEGDVCCIMFGAFSPFILRETGWKTGRLSHFKVVGETFMVSKRSPEADGRPYRVGSGRNANEDWLDLGLNEEDILLC